MEVAANANSALLTKLCFENGLAPVTLVRGSWFLKRAEKVRHARTNEERAALRVPRRQELERKEPDALLSPEEVAAMPRGHAGHYGQRVPSQRGAGLTEQTGGQIR